MIEKKYTSTERNLSVAIDVEGRQMKINFFGGFAGGGVFTKCFYITTDERIQKALEANGNFNLYYTLEYEKEIEETPVDVIETVTVVEYSTKLELQEKMTELGIEYDNSMKITELVSLLKKAGFETKKIIKENE